MSRIREVKISDLVKDFYVRRCLNQDHVLFLNARRRIYGA
jgi:hypothetical protein